MGGGKSQGNGPSTKGWKSEETWERNAGHPGSSPSSLNHHLKYKLMSALNYVKVLQN